MLKVSTMSGKLEGIGAINTSSLDNPYCNNMSKLSHTVCHYCYSRKMLKTYRQNARPAWKENGNILSTIYIYRGNVKFKTDLVRFNCHGELLNARHLYNLVYLADNNPKIQFALYTKRTGIVNIIFKKIYKPKNLQLIYSNPSLNNLLDTPPKHFDKVFNVIEKVYYMNEMFLTDINCANKKCIECRLCYSRNDTTVINELLK